MFIYNQQSKSLSFQQFRILLLKTTKKTKQKLTKTSQIKS